MLLLTAGYLLAGCDPGSGAQLPTLELTVCGGEFAQLASARAGDAALEVAEAERRTLEECSSREEWLSTASSTPGALPDDESAAAALERVCVGAEPQDAPACSAPTPAAS